MSVKIQNPESRYRRASKNRSDYCLKAIESDDPDCRPTGVLNTMTNKDTEILKGDRELCQGEGYVVEENGDP